MEKINLYDSDFYSHKEIRDMLKEKNSWGEEEIKERRNRIIAFIKENWKLN